MHAIVLTCFNLHKMIIDTRCDPLVLLHGVPEFEMCKDSTSVISLPKDCTKEESILQWRRVGFVESEPLNFELIDALKRSVSRHYSSDNQT